MANKTNMQGGLEVKHPDFGARFSQAVHEAEQEGIIKNLSDLGRMTGIEYEMLRRYKMGVSKPRDTKMKILAEKLNKSPAWLRFGDGVNITNNGSTVGVQIASNCGSIPEINQKSLGVREQAEQNDDLPNPNRTANMTIMEALQLALPLAMNECSAALPKQQQINALFEYAQMILETYPHYKERLERLAFKNS